MKLSLAAAHFVGKLPRFMSFDSLSQFVRERGLYPADGKMMLAEGQDLSKLLRMQNMQQIESRINALVFDMKNAQRNQRETLRRTSAIAEKSTDPYELHYLAGMFASKRAIIRAIAKNQTLSRETQILIARNPEMNKDRETLMNLAHNPSVTEEAMEVLIEVADDPFVLHGVALNASMRSQAAPGDTPYAAICAFLAKDSDYTLSKAAVPGVRDPDVLREIVENNSLIFSPEKLAAVAKNPHTPDDVLEQMSTRGLPQLQRALGYDVADLARHTLEIKKQQLRVEPEVSNSL